MGKSRTYKKRYKYTKVEFINICCEKCGLCPIGTSPDLCYSELYTLQPKRFIKVVFRNLLEIRKLSDKNGYIRLYTDNSNVEYLEYLFRNAFCSANLCGKYKPGEQCDNIIGCIAAFRRQVKGYTSPEHYNVHRSAQQTTKQKNKKKKKKKQRYVAKPYPTFFTNGNAAFLKEINEIIYGKHKIIDCPVEEQVGTSGNSNKEQDTTKELTAQTE